MAIFFPGSSEQSLAAALKIVTLPDSDIVAPAAAATDELLPETAPVDRIRLLIQSPRKLYLYWELARDPFIALRRSVGTAQAENYRLVVRLTNTENGTEHLREADRKTRAAWFDAFPGTAYKAAVGLFAPGQGFIRLLSSNSVHTPRAGVSPLTESTPEFRVAPMEFARVLDQAGYAGDALEVALEALDAQTHNQATREILEGFGDKGEAFAANNFDFAEIRALIVALVFGAPLAAVQPTLSPALSQWIENINIGHGELFDAARVLELLRSVLHFELSVDSAASIDETTRTAARFMWSASRVNLPSRPAHVWLPSMALRFGRN